MIRRISIVILGIALMGTPYQASAGPTIEEQTIESATYLLKTALTPTKEGQHVRTLLALRQLEDPELAPLFSYLTQTDDPVLQIHGILGLAEISENKQIDLVRITALEPVVVQERMIQIAMQADMITDDQAEQLVNWPKLDIGVRVRVAAQLVEHGKFDDMALLDKALMEESPALIAFTHLLRLHLGKTDALDYLDKLNEGPKDDKNEVLRGALLTRALEMNTTALGPWALQIAQESKVSRAMLTLALKTALRFQAPGAEQYWLEQYNSTTDIAQHMRLGLIAAREARWVSPELFNSMINSESIHLQHLGRAGRAIATNTGITDAVVAIIGLNPPHSTLIGWVMRYAETEASPDTAKAIYLAMILNMENVSRYRARMLDNAMSATSRLNDKFPDEAVALLSPILYSPDTKPDVAIAILYGLHNARKGEPQKVAASYQPPKSNLIARHFLWLLNAKHGAKLEGEQLEDIGLMVRGGGGGAKNPSMRVQGAWLYLKATGQSQSVLTRVLDE